MLAGTLLLAAACGGGSPKAAGSPGQRLYQQALAYSRCMHAHGVPEFPGPRPGPGGSLSYPLSPPPGMLSSPGYDAAFRGCLKLAVTGGQNAARFQAMADQTLRLAECMRAHGITSYPSPAALGGGIHTPDLTAIGVDPHTLQFYAAGIACDARPVAAGVVVAGRVVIAKGNGTQHQPSLTAATRGACDQRQHRRDR